MTVRKWNNEPDQKGWTFTEGVWKRAGKANVQFCVMFSQNEAPGVPLQYHVCAKGSKFNHKIAQIQFDEKRDVTDKPRPLGNSFDLKKIAGKHVVFQLPKGPQYCFGLGESIKKESAPVEFVVKPFDPKDKSNWLVWDEKTKTFRVGEHKTFGLSTQEASITSRHNNIIASSVNKLNVKNLFFKDGSLQFKKNGNVYCLTFQKNYTPGHNIKWEPCYHQANQQLKAWWIEHRSSMRKTNTARIAHWITKEGVRKVANLKAQRQALVEVTKGDITHNPFMIVNRSNKKQHLFMSEEKVGADRVLKLTRDQPDWRALFIYDRKTKSIRLHSRKQYALSNQDSDKKGKERVSVGRTLAMRTFKHTEDQIARIEDGKIKNSKKKCMTPKNYGAKESATIEWWNCNKNPTQYWEIKFYEIQPQKARHYSDKPVNVNADKVKLAQVQDAPKPTSNPFFITQKKNNEKTQVFMSRQIEGKDHVLKLGRGVDTWRSLFIYDRRTRSIRLHAHRELALSSKHASKATLGQKVSMRKYNGDKSQVAGYCDDKIKNARGKCLTPKYYKNKHANFLIWWTCNKNPSQYWKHDFLTIGGAPPRHHSDKKVETVSHKHNLAQVEEEPRHDWQSLIQRLINVKETISSD